MERPTDFRGCGTTTSTSHSSAPSLLASVPSVDSINAGRPCDFSNTDPTATSFGCADFHPWSGTGLAGGITCAPKSQTRRRGLDFLVAWLPEHHPEWSSRADGCRSRLVPQVAEPAVLAVGERHGTDDRHAGGRVACGGDDARLERVAQDRVAAVDVDQLLVVMKRSVTVATLPSSVATSSATPPAILRASRTSASPCTVPDRS